MTTGTSRRPPGAGSVTPTPAGTWRVRVRDGAGRRRCVGTYADEAEARATLAAALRRLDALELPAVGVVTLRAWGETWLASREARGVDKERSVWRRHVVAHLGDLALHEVTRAAVSAWVEKLRGTPATTSGAGSGRGARVSAGRTLSPLTVKHALRLLRAALAAAVDAGRLRENAAREVRPPKPRAAVHEPWTFLEPAEVAAVTGCPEIPDPERTIYTVAIYTGLRLGELWGLRWEDVRLDGDRPEVTVRRSHAGATKSGKVRRVPLLPQARAALDALAGRRDGWVFPGEHGQRRRDDDARWSPGWRFVDRASGARERVAVNGYRLRAGITRRVRFHDLRHTCASHLLMGTWGVRLPIEEVSAWLGHSSTAVTQRYAHLAPDHLSARVAEAFRAPVPPPVSPVEGSSGGTAATRSLPRKPLENQRRAMQESNLRPSASETERRRTNPAGTQGDRAPAVPPQSHAVTVLLTAARGDDLPGALLTELARAAILAGVRGDLALQLLDGTAGAHAARVAVDLAGALLTPAAARSVEAG